MTDRNDRIRELAHVLWLEEGCPEGEAERHWLAAEALLESDPVERKRASKARLRTNPKTASRR